MGLILIPDNQRQFIIDQFKFPQRWCTVLEWYGIAIEGYTIGIMYGFCGKKDNVKSLRQKT